MARVGGRRGAFKDGNSEVDIKDVGWEDLDSINLARYMKVAGCCEHCDELAGFIKRREFFDE